MNILGIETSCDETAAAVVADGRRILSNVVSSQIPLHQPYGGVVPELASRRHLELIDTVIPEAMQRAGLEWTSVAAVAATHGPGLASSLLIGLNAGKGIAAARGVPFVPVNHLEAHLYSPLLALADNAGDDAVFPMVALIASGGHTILALVSGRDGYRMLGQTLDDAAGEAFDKVAKLLGLGYPGGPAIDRLARDGNPAAVTFPRSMLDDPSDNFSFSGLKTAVLYYLRRREQIGASGADRGTPTARERSQPVIEPLPHPNPLPHRGEGDALGGASPPRGRGRPRRRVRGRVRGPSTGREDDAPPSVADIAASFQEAAVDVLVGKTLRAARAHGVKVVSASGGVSLNSRFRQKLEAAGAAAGIQLCLADAKLCTDNAAMIAARAFQRLADGATGDWACDVAPSIGLPNLTAGPNSP